MKKTKLQRRRTMILSAILVVLGFVMNFILDGFFWWVMLPICQIFSPALFPQGLEGERVLWLTVSSVLLPAFLAMAGCMQEQMVCSTGARRAEGDIYIRLRGLLEDICRRGNLPDPDFYRLYVMEDRSINAFALGNRHIVVHTGALLALTDGELEGILAHEMGHLQHHHTMLRLFTVGMSWFGNVVCFVYTFLIFVSRLIEWIPIIGWLVAIWISIVTWIHYLCSNLLYFPISLFNAFGSRRQEYEADSYAKEIGLAENLARSFETMQRIYGNQKSGFFASLWDDHPDLPKRIEKLRE